MKVAQIGTGGWGKNHTRILSQLGVLSAVCDANKERSKEYAEKYSVNSYDSVDALLDSGKFDAAFICTPTSTHSQIATQLIQKKNNVLMTCGYIERFNPAVGLVKDYVKSKKYGELVMLEFHRENRMPLHIKDVGIIYDTSVHDIDTAMWLFDDTPQVVFARAGSIKHKYEDFATIMLGFKDNKVAIISSNWITPTRVRNFNAVCTEGIISADFISQGIRIETDKDTEIPRNEKQEPLLLEIQNFLGAMEGKNELRVKPEQAVNVTKIAEASLLSSQKGTPIYLELQ